MMEDDSFHRRCLESANFHVEGMEAVVATVSGYHGSERFNLIKLIAGTGASFVGNMNGSTTHLVCWKFEGNKYNFAKKLRISIVNHRWIEECVRKGRRVPEEPYSFQSGEDSGPLSIDILSRINQVKDQSYALKKKKPVIDIDFDARNSDPWDNPRFGNENLFSQETTKSTRRNKREGLPSSSRHCPTTLSRPILVELEERSTSMPACSSKPKKQKFNSPERRSKGRKLVKKHSSVDCTSLEDCEEVEVLPRNNNSTVLHDSSDGERHPTLSRRNNSNINFSLSGLDNSDVCHAVTQNLLSSSSRNKSLLRRFLSRQENFNACDEVEEIVKNVNDGNENACVDELSSPRPTSEGEDPCEDNVDVNPSEGLPSSKELSCVICWTDFCSTRGVLQCGHRFCFSCIQNWADHMASINKPSTCPLCKASFICITKVEDAASSDQKIYSQSIPSEFSERNLYILPDGAHVPPGNSMQPSEAVCGRCFSREPEDLLIRCHFCQVRCVHSYCLDPPLLPWTCIHCKDLQMLYIHSR